MPDTPPHATPAGLNAIIGYDWPLPIRPPRGLALLLATPALPLQGGERSERAGQKNRFFRRSQG